MKKAVDTVKSKLDQKTLSIAVSQIDKAVKYNLITKNRAARMKSRLSALLTLSSSSVKTSSKPASK